MNSTHTEATCIRVLQREHVARTKSQHLHTHEMLRVHASGICCSDVSHEVHGTCRGDKITPKLVLHNCKSITSHKGTCRCNISPKHVPAQFSRLCTCCDFKLSLLHVPAIHIPAKCLCNMSLLHDDPLCLPTLIQQCKKCNTSANYTSKFWIMIG